ncbi:MAG: PAS domain S-box protein, partial [Chloroflexi bacterium]|nr:PAS domain S-box protein [Chloroflexota bacterium]
MNTNFTLYIAPLAAAAVISAIAAIYTWTRRSTNGAIPLLLMAASITIWSVGYAFEIALPGLAQKYAAGVIQYIGIALAPYAWLWFAISYNELKRFLNRRAILLTAVVPFSTILLAFTTKWHGLIWSEYHLNQEGDFSSLGVSYGVWFFVHSAYSYLILLIGVILLLRALFRKQGMYRGQITALLIAVLAPVAGNVLYLTGNSPIPHLDLTPFAFTISVAALAWAIFGFHLVDVTPLARELVIDFMREGMIVLDGRGNIVDINNAASRMIGTAVADAIGKTARNIFQPWPTLIENAGGTVEAIEEFTVGEGNSQRRYRARFSPLSDSGNNIIGRVIMMRSLDDAQSAIRQAEEQIRKLSRAVEQSANSIIITDTEGHIEYVNPRFVAVTGYSFEEIKGKNPRILKSGRQRPEFYEKLWKTITSGEVWHGVFHNKRKDGSLYWESATIAPVFNDDGIVTNFVAIKEDITTRRQAEEQLRKLSQAVEQSGNTVIIMDSEGVIEYVNPKFTEVTGYSAAEAIGKSTSELMAGVESRRNYREDDWWKTVNAGRTWHGEFHNKRKDGSLFWESATIGPVHDENGVVVNFVEIKQDVTDEKLLQEQLEKQNDYLSVLHQITLDLLNRRETSDLLQAVVDRSAVLLDVPYSELMLVNGNELVVHAATGNMHTIKGERVTREQAKLSWEAFDSRQPVVMEDYSTWAGRRHEYDEYAVHATAEIPILAGDRSLGVLSVGRSQPNYPFTAEQIETGILFAQLTALVLDNVGLYESAMQELAERKRVEAQNEAFLHDIKALQEISLELSETETLKELYVKMIRLAQNRLGLERIGLFVIDAQTNELQGTFGIDQDGNVRDESYYREAMHEGHWTEEIVEAHNHTKLWVDAPIFDNGRAVGHGWKTASALWNGQRAVGYIVADCFVTRRPARPYEAELTSLLGNTFGHLIEIKQNEVRLQESEVRFRQIVENAGDIIYRTDANGNFTYVNPTSLAIMGYQDEKEVLGRNFLELVVPAFRKEMRKFYYRQFLSKTASTYHEFPAFTAQGEVVWFGQNVRLILE